MFILAPLISDFSSLCLIDSDQWHWFIFTCICANSTYISSRWCNKHHSTWIVRSDAEL